MNSEDVIRLDNAARRTLQEFNEVVDLKRSEAHGADHPYLRHRVELLAQLLADYDDLATQLGGPVLVTERAEQVEKEPNLLKGEALSVYRRLIRRIESARPVVRSGIPVDAPDDTDAIRVMFEDYSAQRARAAQKRRQGQALISDLLVRELGLEGRAVVKPPPMRIGRISGSECAFGVINLAGMQPRDADGAGGPPPPPPLTTFLDGIQRSLEAGAFGPALLSALAVPDACGAIEYPEKPKGETRSRNSFRYETWYDRFVEAVVDQELKFDGKAAWRVRNGMIHETGLRFKDFGYDRVLFLPPSDIEIGVGLMRNMGPDGESAFVLDLQQHVTRIIAGAKDWLASIADDDEKQARLETLIQLRPEGLSPFFVGVPILY